MNPVPNDLLVPIFRDARDMLLLTWAGVRAPSAAALDTAAAFGRSIHKAEKELTERLVGGSDEAAPLRLVPAHVERIGNAIEGIIRSCQLMEAEGTTFTPSGMREVNALFERAREHALPGPGYRLRPRARGPASRGCLPSSLLECISRHPRLPARDHAPRTAHRGPHRAAPESWRGALLPRLARLRSHLTRAWGRT